MYLLNNSEHAKHARMLLQVLHKLHCLQTKHTYYTVRGDCTYKVLSNMCAAKTWLQHYWCTQSIRMTIGHTQRKQSE